MKKKLLILGILILLPSVLSSARIRSWIRKSPLPAYDPNYCSPYISPDIENHLDHIDSDFLTKTNIIDELRHTDLFGLHAIKNRISNSAFLYHKPDKDSISLEESYQWTAKYVTTTNQLFAVICLLAEEIKTVADLKYYPKAKVNASDILRKLCMIHQKALLRSEDPHPSLTGIHGQKAEHLKTALDYLYAQKDPSLCINGSRLFHTFALAGINLKKNKNQASASKKLERVFVVPPRGDDGKLKTQGGGVGYRLKE